MRRKPMGRGFWVWHLDQCEGGDLAKIAAKCKACDVTWLAIKAGDHGRPWSQFTAAMVSGLQAAGICVFGWAYDVPGDAVDQAKIVQIVADAGADGFLIDAEIEWERPADPDAAAAEYVDAILALGLPDDFTIGHAPFDVISAHQRFPYTALGQRLQIVAPQMYWSEHCIPVDKSTRRALDLWTKYRTQHPDACKTLIACGYSVKPDSGYHSPTAAEILQFETMCAAAGCPGALHWRWDGTPDSVWAGLSGTTYPAPAGICADPAADAPGC